MSVSHRLALSSIFVLAAAVASAAQATRPAITGDWQGVVSGAGSSMKVSLTLTEADGKVTGTLKTPHGDWPVTSVEQANAVWTVTVTRGDGGAATMTGKIDAGVFAGDWNNAPMAVGTFKLTRASETTIAPAASIRY